MTVLLLSIDGLRPDALGRAHTPTFEGLRRPSAFSLDARSVMPSITLPCHLSIFYSVPPERHNVLTNDYTPMVRPLPGLVEVLSQAGKRCAAFYCWEPLRDVSRPLSLAHSSFLYTGDPDRSDKQLLQSALPHLSDGEFDFIFLHLGAIDKVGHDHGWMSDAYLRQVESTDRLLMAILEALPGDATLLAHSDHGGHDRHHGTDLPEDMTIPWFLMGPTVKRGHELETSVSLLDTAPTVAKLLDVAADDRWEGEVVTEAFIS